MGGGPHGPTLGVISCHSVGDAPTNSKFLDFSQIHPYFHLVKSFFTFFCNFYKKITVKKFVRPKKERFFHENGQKHLFLTNIGIFCFNYVISMLWEIFWGALHVCRSKIGDVENSWVLEFLGSHSWGGVRTNPPSPPFTVPKKSPHLIGLNSTTNPVHFHKNSCQDLFFS